jgi:hypothetical protein
MRGASRSVAGSLLPHRNVGCDHRHGKPAGVFIGFESEDDWLEYRLENDPRFLKRIAKARASLRGGRGVALEDME